MIRNLCLVMTCFFIQASWSQTGWIQVDNGENGPPPRRGVAGIYDQTRGQLVFQGGESPGAMFFGETWVFDIQTQEWNNLAIPNPSARCHHTFVKNISGDFAFLFGGFPRTNELWRWSLAEQSWTEITPESNNPMPRCLHSSVINEQSGQMIVYGGLNGGFTPDLDDTWMWDPAANQWNQLTTNSPPGLRYGHAAVIDEERNRMVLFGGFHRDGQMNNSNAGDTWSFDFATNEWTERDNLNLSPSPRQFGRAVELPNENGFLLFGGRASGGFLNDLWMFRYEDSTWIPIEISGAKPEPRFRHTFIIDESSNTVWTGFGEGENSIHYSDLWKLNLNELDSEDVQGPAGIADWIVK